MDVPTERALAAIAAVARSHGLPVDRMHVVRDLTNVLVHLQPAPIVARVPVTLARLRDREWFAQVLALADFLAELGAPVAPPARDVDPGPHGRDGLLVEFWSYVDHDSSRFDAKSAGRSLRELHEALATYPEPLPGYDRFDEVAALLDLLEPSEHVSAGDLAVLRDAHGRLTDDPILPGAPLHGDAHFRNILWSPDGPLWTDLENVCSGPVEYDLAAIAWRRLDGMDDALAAYGDYEEEVVERVTPALALFLAAWTIPIVERDRWSEGGKAELRRRIDWIRDWCDDQAREM